ncbi:MAG: drug/metabolite transporter (DMT)-like permease [Gammaproteobacteria bacterium]|jgi:drug/metabolite transporter (DMT)-like permease
MKDDKKGIILVVISMTIFAVQDILIKFLSADISIFQILFCRSIIGVTLICVYLKLSHKPIKFGTAYPLLSTCRGLLFFFGYSTFYFAQSKVPIANATVLFLVSPFFITILSIIVFGSLVGVSRWITMIIGFSGVIIIAQPESGDFNFFYILPLITALTYAVSMVIAKFTAKEDDLFQQIIYMYLITAMVSGLIGLGIGDGRLNTAEFSEYQFITQGWHFDQISLLVSIFAVGIVGTIAFLLLTSAYRIADPATISPFEYTGLISTLLGGFIFWGDIPTLNEAFGMVLIVGSGILLFYRENLKKQSVASVAPLR